MKKVTGYFSCRPLGCYNFEFMVDSNVTNEEIQNKINKQLEISSDFNVEEGYEAETVTIYKKRDY